VAALQNEHVCCDDTKLLNRRFAVLHETLSELYTRLLSIRHYHDLDEIHIELQQYDYEFIDDDPTVFGIFFSPPANCSRSEALKKWGATSSNQAGLISMICRMYDFDVITSS